MIKYKKHESPGWWYKIDIDEDGNESRQSFDKKHGWYKEMMDSGAPIEPLYTSEELEQKEDDDLQNALESQKSQCIQLLKDTLHTQSDDFDYPDDKGTWKTYRDQVKTVMRSGQIETIPDKPTF